MENKPNISVIVPIYNNERHLKQCIESLTNQTLENIEIILVNDGSSDGSQMICESYEKMDSRIKLINQKNSGVSAARNRGMKIARGRYIAFSDSDDYYELDALKKLYCAAELNKADWVIGATAKDVFGRLEVVSIDERVAVSKEERQRIIVNTTQNYMINQLWGKLYRLSIIKENNVYMRSEMSCGEDVEWICRFVSLTKVIASIAAITYHYVVRNAESLSQRFNPDYFANIEKQYSSIKRLYISEDMWETHGNVVMSQQAHNIVSGYAKISKADCSFSFKEKIKFVYVGINLESAQECRKCKGVLDSKKKQIVLHMKNATLIVLLMGVFK